MANYEEEQIEKVLKTGWSSYRIKITSDNAETNWLNASPSQVKKIKNILRTH